MKKGIALTVMAIVFGVFMFFFGISLGKEQAAAKYALLLTSAPTVLPQPAVEETETPETVIEDPVVTPPQPAVNPTSTTEPRYDFHISLETSSEDFGWYHLNLTRVQSEQGRPAEQVWDEMTKIVEDVQDVCGYHEYAMYGDNRKITNRFRWEEDAMEGACWDKLEEISGMNLTHSDPALDDPRSVACMDKGKDCVILSNDTIKQAHAVNTLESTMLQDKSGRFYSVFSSWNRLSPNIKKYSSFGEMRFVFPTTVILPETGLVSQMGITNWGGSTLCYLPTGLVETGEVGTTVPSYQNKVECINASEFPTTLDTEGAMPTYYSIAPIGNDMYIAWDWVPLKESDRVTLYVIDVNVLRLLQVERPSIFISAWEDIQEYPANQFEWRAQDHWVVQSVDTAWMPVGNQNTDWKGYVWVFTGMTLKLGNEERYVNYGFDFNFVNDTGHEVLAGPWSVKDYIEPADTLIVISYDAEDTADPLRFQLQQ